MQISLYKNENEMTVVFADKIIVNKDSNDKTNSIVLVSVKSPEEWEEHTSLAANDNGSILYKGVVYQAYKVSLDDEDDDEDGGIYNDPDDEDDDYDWGDEEDEA
jgi:hypothetical protein